MIEVGVSPTKMPLRMRPSLASARYAVKAGAISASGFTIWKRMFSLVCRRISKRSGPTACPSLSKRWQLAQTALKTARPSDGTGFRAKALMASAKASGRAETVSRRSARAFTAGSLEAST